MKKFIDSWGAQFILTLRGTPDEVSRTVNTFCNFGIIQEPPIGYQESQSEAILAVTQKKFQKGLLDIASFELAQDRTLCASLKGQPGEKFAGMAKERAAQEFASYERAKLDASIDVSRADMSVYKVDADQLTPEFKASKARILEALTKRNRRSAGSPRAESSRSVTRVGE